MFKKIDKEILFGGIFGIIAIVAAVGEMIANGVSDSTILGATKDIAGTLVGVMVFIIAIKHLFVKKATDFYGVFHEVIKKQMEVIKTICSTNTEKHCIINLQGQPFRKNPLKIAIYAKKFSKSH